MKKTTSVLIVLALVLFTGLGWYMYFNRQVEFDAEYRAHMEKAAVYEEKRIYIDAIKEYQTILEMNETPDYDLLLKIANDYLALGDEKGFIDYCDQAIALSPNNLAAYKLEINHYSKANKIEDALSVAKEANRKVPGDSEVEAFIDSFFYKYEINYAFFDSFGDWYEQEAAVLMPVMDDGKYGLMTSTAGTYLKCKFDDIGYFNPGIGVASAALDGEYYFVDSQGYRKLSPFKDYEYIGPFGNNYAPAELDGVYGYLNVDMEEFSFEFDFAGSFFYNVSAVKKGNKWALFGSNQKLVTDFIYDDILMDQNHLCSQFGMVIAVQNGKYLMLDTKGNQIGTEVYEELRLPASMDGWIAFRKGNKWGFMDRSGNVQIEPKYEDARSFSLDLAAVMAEGKWGFINTEQEMIVPAGYYDVRPFNSQGSALVFDGQSWRIIILSRFVKSDSGSLF